MSAVVSYIAIGSNLNSPLQQVKNAITQLATLPQSTLQTVSSLYKTTPIGFAEQPDFINAVVALQTELAPNLLLVELQKLEKQQGRVRVAEQNAPRTLDLDILLYGHLKLNTSVLIIPHPRLHERAFTLYPLVEIAPNLLLPDGKSVRELLKNCSDQNIEKMTNS